MVPLNEKFEKKIVCTFEYIDNEIVEDKVNQELVKKIIFGEDRMLEKKMIAAKEEISNLKDQERALRYVCKSEILTKSICSRSIITYLVIAKLHLQIDAIKNANNKKCAPKLIFFNEKKIEKDSDNF